MIFPEIIVCHIFFGKSFDFTEKETLKQNGAGENKNIGGLKIKIK